MGSRQVGAVSVLPLYEVSDFVLTIFSRVFDANFKVNNLHSKCEAGDFALTMFLPGSVRI